MKFRKLIQIQWLILSMFLLMINCSVFSAVKLNNIEVREIGEKSRLIISLDQSSEYQISSLTNPFRIVINFSEKVLTSNTDKQEFSGGLVNSVKYLTIDSSSETELKMVDAFVVELKSGTSYDVSTQGEDVVIDVVLKSETNLTEEKITELNNLIESAKSNYQGEYFLLAKADIESALAIDETNGEARRLLKKIDNKIEENEKSAANLAAKISQEKDIELDQKKEDAAKLASILEDKQDEEMEADMSFKDLVKKGKVLYKKKRYEEAIEFWEQATTIKDDDDIFELIAKAQSKIKSRRASSSVKSIEDEEVLSLLAQGEEEFSNLNYAMAIGTFEKALALDPGNLNAMRYIAKARKNQREYVAEGGSAEDVVLDSANILADYGVMNIDQAIKLGLANHIPSKVAQEEVLLAKVKVGQAKRELFPKVKIKYKTTEGTTTGEDFEGEEYGAELQQNIYAGGRYKTLYNQARVNLAVSRKNYEKTKATFVFEVIQAYYNLAFAKSKMKNKLALLKKVEDLLATAEKQYAAKALTLAEILEARNQKEEVLFQKQQIENDLDLAMLGLRQLLSLSNDTNFDVIEIPEPILFDLEPRKLIEVGYDNRRDYQVKKLLVLFNKYGVEIAQKKRAFNVELTGSFGQRDEYYVSEQVDLKDEYYIGLKVSKPLGPHVVEMNGVTQDKVPQVGQTTSTEYQSAEVALKLWEQKDRTNLAQANISYHKALSELENSKRTLVHDVHSSVFSVKEAEAKMKNKKSAVTMITEELRSTRAKSKVEQATIVQVMRTETKLWNAKTDYVSAQADYYVSIAKLNKNIGVNYYFDPSSGVKSTDKEGHTPGIRLLVTEKSEDTESKWYKFSPYDGGIASYYPDDVVSDVLKEKQDESVFGSKKFLGIFKRKEKKASEYKAYDEKYEFKTPAKKAKWYQFFKKNKYDDDFSEHYKSNEEYDDAFTTETKVDESYNSLSEDDSLNEFMTGDEKEMKDYFQEFLADKSRKVFTQLHIEENQYETILAIRSNASVESTVSVLENPNRLLISLKDVVISALPDYESINKGQIVSVKAFHTKTVLPSRLKDWKRLLSLIIELDGDYSYVIESSDNIFKVKIKK